MRTTLVLLLLTVPAWASPPVAPPVKAAKVEAKKPEPKKAEPRRSSLGLEGHTEAKKADAAPSTLSLSAPAKKKPHRTLPDWQP